MAYTLLETHFNVSFCPKAWTLTKLNKKFVLVGEAGSEWWEGGVLADQYPKDHMPGNIRAYK